MAFDVNGASRGFTPILNHDLVAWDDSATLFGELVVPFRFQNPRPGDLATAIGVALHAGLKF